MYPTFLVDRHVAILQTHETLFPILFRIPDVEGAFDREGTDLTTDEQQKKTIKHKNKTNITIEKTNFSKQGQLYQQDIRNFFRGPTSRSVHLERKI